MQYHPKQHYEAVVVVVAAVVAPPSQLSFVSSFIFLGRVAVAVVVKTMFVKWSGPIVLM